MELEQAWNWRVSRGLLEKGGAQRVFHGPGEGRADSRFFAIDQLGEHFWVTQWAHAELSASREQIQRQRIIEFLRAKGAQSVVGLGRPQKGVAPESQVWWGKAPQGAIEVREGELKFLVRLVGTRHPGIFLDHRPLRSWLQERARGWRVLNTFAYTGSLSLAAARAGASQVTTLDLSKTTLDWARENFICNGFASEEALEQQGSPYRFIAGDALEWLPRLKKSGEKFDCVILDPPSFSHGKKKNFSTAKDLPQLHLGAMELLEPGGVLVSSINSANISWQKFESDLIQASLRARGKNSQLPNSQTGEWQILKQMDLPETFPTRLGDASARYLKGFILQRMDGRG